MEGYDELGFIDIILNHGQTLGNQLSLNFLLSQNDLNPGLQVKDTEIRLEWQTEITFVLVFIYSTSLHLIHGHIPKCP